VSWFVEDDFDKKVISSFGQAISRLIHLRSFSFNLTTSSNQDSGSFMKFLGYLNVLQDLKEINLDFTNYAIISGEVLKKLANVYRNLKSLEKISLSLAGNHYTPEKGIVQIADSWSFLENLKELDLNLNRNYGINKQGLSALGSLVGKKKIETFGLNLRRCDIKNDDLSSFFIQIPNFGHLKKLTMDLSECSHLSDEILTYFDPLLKTAQNLQALDLGFRKLNLKKISAWKQFESALGALINLKELKLVFEGQYHFSQNQAGLLNDAHLNTISNALGNLTSLSEITLYCDSGKFLSSLKTLGQSLNKLNNLEKLLLSFVRVENLDNKLMEIFGKELQDLPNLKKLNINLWETQFDFSGRKAFMKLFKGRAIQINVR